jgi:hypothetical protein
MDIDRLHVSDQVYGFGSGNEVIERVAELLAQSRLPSALNRLGLPTPGGIA